MVKLKYFLLGVVVSAALLFSQIPSSNFVAVWSGGKWYYLRADSTLKVDLANSTIGVASVPAPAEAQEAWDNLAAPTTVFELSKLPISLKMYRNGILQRRGIDYTVSATTVTFLPASTPQKEDIVQAVYYTGQ